MSQYQIDKNIPMSLKNMRSKYPFAQMEVGDSFFVPSDDVKNINALRQSFYRYAHEHGRRFVAQHESGGYRVFRVD
jgi:hypothetical protein